MPIQDAKLFDARYFAMLNNAVAIGNDEKYEGGNPTQALEYYQFLLNLELPELPASMHCLVDPIHDALIKTRIDNIQQLDKDINGLAKLFPKDLRCVTQKIIEKFSRYFDSSQVCYFPSGYQNSNGGHFAVLKIRKFFDKGYALSYLNLGDGVQFHELLVSSDTKKKYAYQSDEYIIDNLEELEDFLTKIIALRYDCRSHKEKNNEIKPYDAHDMYGLLMLSGRKWDLTKKSEKSATPQRTGTCPLTNTNMMQRDTLIDHDVEFKKRKHAQFIFKLRSIIAGFEAYRQGNTTYTLPILQWALHEFSVRLNKQYKTILTMEEFNYCAALHSKLQTEITVAEQKDIQDKLKPLPFPSFSSKEVFDDVLLFPQAKIPEEHRPQWMLERIPETPDTILDPTTPDNFASQLLFKPNTPFQTLFNYFLQIPRCSGLEKDPFFDKVPDKDVLPIVERLSNLVNYACLRNENKSSEEKAQLFALLFIFYDITAQLAPRIEDLRFNDRYTLGLSDVYSEKYIFTDPVLFHLVKRIVENFERRATDKTPILGNTLILYQNDSTIHYFMRYLLDESDRKELSEVYRIENQLNHSHFNDEVLFRYFVVRYNHQVMKQKINPVLFRIISISASAHSGEVMSNYNQSETNLFFVRSRLRRELTSYRDDFSQIGRHLPSKEKTTNADAQFISVGLNQQNHHDFSENTIFLKDEHRRYFRSLNQVNEPSLPYQVMLTGSFHHESKEWNPRANEQPYYEMLNEDFRCIESSPNFQVIKILDWAKNNLEKLDHSIVRIRVRELIFEYGKLNFVLVHHTEVTLSAVKSLFTNLNAYIRQNQKNNTDLLTWAATLESDLRYFSSVSAKVNNIKMPLFKMNSLKELLLEKIKFEKDADTRSHLASVYLQFHRHQSDFSQNQACLLLVCQVAIMLGDSVIHSNATWQVNNKKLIKVLIENKNEMETKIGNLLREFNLSNQTQWHLVDQHLKSADNKYLIDLSTGSLKYIGSVKRIKERTFKTIADNQPLFAKLNLTEKNIKIIYEEVHCFKLKSEDGIWEFEFNYINDLNPCFKIKRTFQLFTIENTKAQFELLDPANISNFTGL